MSGEATFGAWLKEYRKAHDLMRPDLARHIGCSAETIHKIESGLRRPSRQIAELLADYLRIAPSQREAFVQFARSSAGQVASETDVSGYHPPDLQPPGPYPP